jgi:menaquinone-dependent protoporphyrinogen oxidase
MTKVLVVVASRHGATRGIADRIGGILRAGGIDASVVSPEGATNVAAADAFVIGSAVYMGSWLKEGIEFLERNASTLADRPVWLFSSGPLPGSTAARDASDPLTDALGPAEGPGSGGRKKVEELSAAIHPRGHRVFQGAFDPNDPPRAIAERLVRLMPASNDLLPPGDFREWDAIETWAHEIAAELHARATVA